MDFKYAIFDLDGTLLDSMKVWRKNEAQQMNIFAQGTLTDEQLAELEIYGYGEMIKKAEHIVGKSYDRKSYTEALHAKMKNFYVDGSIVPKKAVPDFLRKLKFEGIKIAAATATPKALCIPCLEKYDILQYFDCIFTTFETRSKFYPDIFDKAINALGSTKQNTVVFEDACYSIKTLVQNNYRVYAVSDDSQTDSDLQFIKQHAEKFIEDYASII